MDMPLDLRPGTWGLFLIPRTLRARLLPAVARLAVRGPLLILDGGNSLNAYVVARAAGGRADILQRVRVARAFTCCQMVSLLEATPALSTPVICLDLLATFFDASLPLPERQRLLSTCLPHFARLGEAAGMVVTVSPPKIALPEAAEFLALLEQAAGRVWVAEAQPVPPPPGQLF
jgi:hypothetical protein